MRTTSFAGAGGFNEFGPTRFAASACCMYASIMSGEAMPVPPVMPLIMLAWEAPPIGDISARRSTAPPEPMRVKPNPQMMKGRYPSENPDPVKLLPPGGGGLTYPPTWRSISQAYRKTNSPAPMDTSPSTINPILRHPVRVLYRTPMDK